MTRRRKMCYTAAGVAASISLTSVPVYADVSPRWTDQQLVGFSDVIVRGRVMRIGVADDPRIGAPYTYVWLDVDDVLRGTVPNRRVVLKQLGGQIAASALHIAGQPTFAVNENVLVFLEVRPRDLTLTTTAQWQGKFTILPASSGTYVAVREDPQVMNRGIFGESVRPLNAWVDSLRRTIGGALPAREVGAIAFVPPEVDRVTLISAARPGPSASWRETTRERPTVRVDMVSPGQSGSADAGEGSIRRAADGWTARGIATLEAGGLQANGCFVAREPDSRITIGIDACEELSPRGGTVALTGTWVREAGTTQNRPARIVGAGIITNTGPIANQLLRSSSCFERVVAHELGHALGLGHGDDDSSGAPMGAVLRCDGGFGTITPSADPHASPRSPESLRTGLSATVPTLVPLRAAPAASTTNVTFTRVSVASDGSQANDLSYSPSISADGRFVAFHSGASSLVPGTIVSFFAPSNIFVHDRLTGITTLENRGPQGVQASGENVLPSISGDGRFVAFQSTATQLVPGVTGRQVYIRDRQLGSTFVASVSSSGAVANGTANEPVISSDGRFVSFYSQADNLVAGDTSGNEKVFTHDRVSGTTTLDCVSSEGVQANSICWGPSISGNGRYIAFESWATNLVPGVTRVFPRVYVRDRLTGRTTLESVGTSSGQSGGRNPAISGDGRFIAFAGAEFFLGTSVGLYLRDRQTGQTVAILPESQSIGDRPAVSADGHLVSYLRRSTGRVEVYDAASGQYIDVATGDVPTPVAGSVIAFASGAALVAEDSNGVPDVFVASAASGTPDPPTNLTYTLIGTTLVLTWQAPAAGNPVAGYVVEAGTVPRGIDVGTFPTGSTATSFTATPTGGGTFYIRVRSANAAGVSAPSNETIVALAALPAAPQSLAASVIGSTVTLAWSPPSTGAVTGYVLEVGSAPGASNLANFSNGSPTTFSATGVPLGTYYVRVRAASFGGVGPPSNEVAVTVGSCAVPAAPTQLTAVVSGSTVSLMWSSADAASTYLLEVGSTSGASDVLVTDLGTAGTTLVASNVYAGTYFVRLRSANSCGTSGPSNETVVVVR